MSDISYWDDDATRRPRVLEALRIAGLSCRPAPSPSPGPDDGRVWLYGATDLAAALPSLEALAASRPVLVLWDGQEAATVLAAMRAGVTDLVQGLDGLADAARRLLDKHQAPARQRSHLVAVCSPKGGAGKTFLTANLAVALRRLTQRPTTVLDLSLPAGNQAMYFDMQPAVSVCDLLALNQIEPEVARQAMTRHASGVDVLAGPPLGRDGGLAGRDVHPLLSAMGQDDGLVVADLGSFLGECHAGVLSAAGLILVPVSPSIASLASLPATLEALELLGVPRDCLMPVLNEASAPGRGLPAATLAALTGGRECLSIPWGGSAVSRSIDDGEPLAWTHPRHKVSRAIADLADLVARRFELVSPQPQPTGMRLRVTWWPGKPNPQGGLRHVSS